MHYLIVFLLIISCSSEKKSRARQHAFSADTEERISLDWDQDGELEFVEITPRIPGLEYRDLIFYTKSEFDEQKKVLAQNSNLIPLRAVPGAKIQLHQDRSFFLVVDSTGTGRAGEIKTWKFFWRKGRFYVSNFSRERIDKLDPFDHQTCELDFRTGRGTRNGSPVRFKATYIDLIDINEKFLPSICNF